ncbi:MAG: hypothetical protein HW386_1100 [Gammaproteobacteria bacterium]|nr:hypothetical protein [Gammaproteobacteria bacterium]
MNLIHKKCFQCLATLVLALIAIGMLPDVEAQALRTVTAEQKAADEAAQASQNQINQLLDKKQDLANKYAQIMAETDSLVKYNEHLSGQVKAQQAEMSSIEKQLLEIETTNREVQPLMQRMVDTLAEFIALDLPFLLEERTKRVADIKDLMLRSDVSISEKYRRIMEAYQIELEFGRTFDSYQGKVGEGDGAKTVEFVRLGRVSLMYQTLDGQETGYWDAAKKSWVQDNNYADAVKDALRVAKKEGAPDLVTVPVPAPQDVKL